MEAPSPAEGSPRSYAQETSPFHDVPAQCCSAKGEEVLGEARGELQACSERQENCKKPVTIGEGRDKRKDLLHPARFLGGASCSLPEQWAAARAAIGETRVLALGTYDLDAVGCGGSVSPKAWLELHNPASQELKLKMFHLPNVGNSGLSSKKPQEGEEGDSLKEIADLESLSQL